MKNPITFIAIIMTVGLFSSCEEANDSPNEEGIFIDVASIDLINDQERIVKGETLQLSVDINPTNATDKKVIWSSSSEEIATVDENGMVSALGIGEVVISAKSEQNESIRDEIVLWVIGTATNEILSLSIDETEGIFIDELTLGLQLPEGADLTSLMPNIEYNGETISPSLEVPQDFTDPVTYTVTSQSGEAKEWLVKIIKIQNAPSSEGFITKWITTNYGFSDDASIKVPTYPIEISDYNYNYTIDWGDGTIEENVKGDAQHSYEIPGTYYVSITGRFPRLYFNDISYSIDSDCQKIISVYQWGNIQWESFYGAFSGCNELDVTANDVPNLTNVYALNYMFSSCEKLVGNSSFQNWDVSNVVSSSSMFASCSLFNQDIGSWNVSNMVSMSGFFTGARSFDQDISGWDMSNVERIRGMFSFAKAFNQDIGNWIFPKVTDLSGMFAGAESFNQDISNWDVSNVEDFSSMFQGAESFDQPIGHWDMSNAIDLAAMFQGADSFTQDITNWDVSNAKNIAVMFASNSTFNQDISGWDVGNVEEMGGLFWNNTIFNQDLSQWDTSNVKGMQKMFMGATGYDRSLGDWDIGNVTNMLEMFKNSGLSTDNYDATLIGWNTITTLKPDVEFDAGSSKYCDGESARQNIIETYNWKIMDGGKSCN